MNAALPRNRRLIAGYCSTTVSHAHRVWTSFWFTPTDPIAISVLRIMVGLLATGFVASHSADLVTWFGSDGLLTAGTVHQLTDSAIENVAGYRWSYLSLFEGRWQLLAAHLLGLTATAFFALGIWTRISGPLALVVVLSYIHRASLLTGCQEPFLTMMLVYLCLAPCGARLSIDAWRRKRSRQKGEQRTQPPGSIAATIAWRLIQLHVALLYFTMALTKLAGDTWWLGEATWWLAAQSESRLVDFTGLHARMVVFDIWTHLIVLFELSFPLLVWFRPLRPLLLVAAGIMWISLGLLTGQIAFCVTAFLAAFSFLDSDHWQLLLAFAKRRNENTAVRVGA